MMRTARWTGRSSGPCFSVCDDQTGLEPRKFFNGSFVMFDKNSSGSIDLDECMSLLYGRYGKAIVEEV